MHLARHINYWAGQRADCIALAADDRAITWRQLGQAGAALVATLQDAGLRGGDRIGCLLPNCLEWCVAFAGVQLAEALFVPLNPLFGPDELNSIIADAGCRLVISNAALFGRLFGAAAAPAGDDAVMIFDIAAKRAVATVRLAAAAAPAVAVRRYDDTAAAVLCYTSGTTGQPKGAVHTHRSINAMVSGLSLGYGMTSEEIFLLVAPLSFTGGVISNLALSLSIGARLILEPGFDPGRTLRLLQEQRVTAFGGAAIFWQRLAAEPGFEAADLASLRHGFTGGSPISPQLIQRFLAKGVGIRQAYGCTEVAGGATLPTRQQAALRPEACGHPMLGIDLEIHAEGGRLCEPEEAGEIVMRGPQMMQGYWNQPEQTARAFAGGWYQSGDIGHFNKFGELVVVDRKKNMVISGGVNIYPAQVEALIAALPQVRESVAFGIPSAAWGEELVAIIVTEGPVDEQALGAALKARLGGYKTPKTFCVTTEPLPRTSTGKIHRAKAPAIFAELRHRQSAPV